jgi:hypothetical protein
LTASAPNGDTLVLIAYGFDAFAPGAELLLGHIFRQGHCLFRSRGFDIR